MVTAHVRYALALALTSACCVMAVVAAVAWSDDQVGLATPALFTIDELDRLDLGSEALDDQMRWSAEIVNGDRRMTEADRAARFAPPFAESLTAASFNAEIDALNAELGEARFVRIIDVEDQIVAFLAATDAGPALTIAFELDDDGRFTFWAGVDSTTGARLPGWASGLALAAAWTATAASVAAWWASARRQAWVLLALAIAATSLVLVLAPSTVLYALGRTVPFVAIPLATWLLLSPARSAVRRHAAVWSWVAAAGFGAATFALDPRAIGHPSLPALADEGSATLRATLALAAICTAVAFSVVVAEHGRLLRPHADRTVGWSRPARAAAAVVATLGIVVAIVTAIDVVDGDAQFAGDVGRGAALVLLCAIPPVALFRAVSARWDRPELAGLVIELEAGAASLDHAVSAAIGGPVAVLRSPDGKLLVDSAGEVVDPESLGAGVELVRVQSDGALVGALTCPTDATERRRLEAIAAAVGLALRIELLHEQVAEQLAEVRASRARIVEASDAARRQIERNLHDGAQQRLVGLGMLLQAARRRSSRTADDELTALLDTATDEVRTSIAEIRSVSRGAPPPLLTERGLSAAVGALAERAPIPVDIAAPAQRLPDRVETTAFYVVAEGLTNVAKHSHASNAAVSIVRDDGYAVVRIVDDGRGGARSGPGTGLEGLEDRVAALGGELIVTSGDGGTTLEATLPCG